MVIEKLGQETALDEAGKDFARGFLEHRYPLDVGKAGTVACNRCIPKECHEGSHDLYLIKSGCLTIIHFRSCVS